MFEKIVFTLPYDQVSNNSMNIYLESLLEYMVEPNQQIKFATKDHGKINFCLDIHVGCDDDKVLTTDECKSVANMDATIVCMFGEKQEQLYKGIHHEEKDVMTYQPMTGLIHLAYSAYTHHYDKSVYLDILEGTYYGIILIYGETNEMTPGNVVQFPGNCMAATLYVDAHSMHDLMTEEPMIGIYHISNHAHIKWYSKHTMELMTYGLTTTRVCERTGTIQNVYLGSSNTNVFAKTALWYLSLGIFLTCITK